MEQPKKIFITNIIIFLLFAILTFFIGLHHEPWADEAQAWLIARDCTISNMILHVLKYEGHPILWFGILRALNILHFPYKLLFIIPWIASCLGIYLLIFKSKLPTIIKYLFPFTYFIFFQYTVIARNHSLIFPLLATIAVFYPKRLNNPYIYTIFLILLANTSAQGFILTFLLTLFFAFDIIKSKNFLKNNSNPKHNIVLLIPIIINLFTLLLTAVFMIKPADCTFNANLDIRNLRNIFDILTSGYFNIFQPIKYLQYSIVLALYFFAYKTFCKNIYQLMLFSALNLSTVTILSTLYCNNWHTGYIILTFIFSCWLLTNENNIEQLSYKENKIFYILALLLFSLQIFWSIKCSVFDVYNNYSASKEVAEFIKDNKLENKIIYGLGFKTVAIQPYFDKNLFRNYKNSAYWQWKQNAQLSDKEAVIGNPDVVIFDFLMNLDYPKMLARVNKDYEAHLFVAHMPLKGFITENNSFVVFVKTKAR